MRPALGFLFVTAAFGGGSVQQTVSQLGQTQNWVVAMNWTGDASTGSVPLTTAQINNCCQGYLITQVETAPLTPAPTSGYALAVLDAAGADVLNGAAGSLSATVPQSFATPASTPPIQGTVTLKITGQGVAGAKGVVYIFITKPGTINLLALTRGGGGGTGPGSGVTSFIGRTGAVFAQTADYNTLQVAGSTNNATFSATPTFDLSLGTIQTIVLTGTVTGAFIMNMIGGLMYEFFVCQDGTGNHSFTWPANVHGPMSVGLIPNQCSLQVFLANGAATALYAITPGVTNQ